MCCLKKNVQRRSIKAQTKPATAGRITGLDIWTKRGLQHSSWDFNNNTADHKLLNLKEMLHLHTAESISTLVEESMDEWGSSEKTSLQRLLTMAGKWWLHSTHMQKLPQLLKRTQRWRIMILMIGRMSGNVSLYEIMLLIQNQLYWPGLHKQTRNSVSLCSQRTEQKL